MSSDLELVKRVAGLALSGPGAHVDTIGALEGLDWRMAGSKPAGAPHSIFEIVNHMTYWQDFALKWLDGKKDPTPEHAAVGWPGAESPHSEEEWEKAVELFSAGLQEMKRRAATEEPFSDRGKKTALEILRVIGSHNSYHIGQVALLRRILDEWPPPGGGATW